MLSGIFVLAVVLVGTHAQVTLPNRVVCTFTFWSQDRNGTFDFVPEDLDATKCSHIKYAFARVNGNSLAPSETDHNAADFYARVGNIARTQNPDVKILLSVGGWTMGSTLFSEMAALAYRRAEFVASSVAFLNTNGFDGLDVDWEFPTTRGGASTDKQRLVDLLKELMEAFEAEATTSGNPQFLLTATVSSIKSVIDDAYDVPEIVNYVDFIMVLTYDMHGPWTSEVKPWSYTTGHHSALYGSGKENIDWVMNYLANLGAPKDMLVMGLATYGRSFTLLSSDTGLNALATGGNAGAFTQTAGLLSYYEICQLIADGATVNEDGEMPYLVSGNQWVSYDNRASLAEKVQYMKNNGYGGVVIWSMDFDDFTDSCGEGTNPLISTVFEETIAPTTTTTTTTSTTTTTTTTAATTPPNCIGKPRRVFLKIDCKNYYICTTFWGPWYGRCPPYLNFDEAMGFCTSSPCQN